MINPNVVRVIAFIRPYALTPLALAAIPITVMLMPLVLLIVLALTFINPALLAPGLGPTEAPAATATEAKLCRVARKGAK